MLRSMKHAKLNDTSHALCLEPGEDIHATLEQFCAVNNINNASIEGLGSVEAPTLAHYSIKTKQFTDKPLAGIYEVASLLGNVALVEGKPFAHLHTTLSDPDMNTKGGHLVKGTCSATLELIVTAYPSHHWKQDSTEIGLKIWNFQH
jgi:predicted DNA-binding protein with PD1-like motif